jgi:hypothetical protein
MEVNMPNTWNDDDRYWRENYRSRPYASGVDYDVLQPGYRYGFEAGSRYRDRTWSDIEPDLQREWTSYEHRGQSTWEQVKQAARDAWERVTGAFDRDRTPTHA